MTPTPTVTPTPVVNKEYEYSKTTSATYSEWSAWTKHVKKNNDGVVFELTDTKETVDLGSIYTKIGTKSAVYENIYFAIGIKILCLILGALGIANMWVAIFADVGVMILAVLNAIRTLFVKNL